MIEPTEYKPDYAVPPGETIKGKFRPGAWHNNDGYNWEIWLDDEQSYTASNVPLVVDIQYGMETGKVVGVTIRDCVLHKAAEIEEEAQSRAQQLTNS